MIALEELVLCMHRNTETAEELIDSLAALYRYQLEHRQRVHFPGRRTCRSPLAPLDQSKHSQHVQWKSHISEVHSLLIMPGALITTRTVWFVIPSFPAESPLILELEADEDGYFVLRHGVNDRLQLHEPNGRHSKTYSTILRCIQRPSFIRVKAGRENYIKFPRSPSTRTLHEPPTHRTDC